jgi:hypothetical protein
MRPIAAECDGGGGGSAVDSWALGAVEHGRRSDMEARLDGRRARRQHRGRYVTKHSNDRGGG